MRPNRFTVIVLALVASAGCRDSTPPDSGNPNATFRGQMAGVRWEGTAGSVVLLDGNVIGRGVRAWSPVGAAEAEQVSDFIAIDVAFGGPGRYDLGTDQLRLLITDDDGMVSEYRTFGTASGEVHITKALQPGIMLEGTLSFTAGHFAGPAVYGPRVTFTEGWFRVTDPAPPVPR